MVNSKCYIGQTITTLNSRFSKHIYCSKQQNIDRVISKAIKKYGKENFIIEEIDVAYNQEQLNLIEGVYISWFNTIAPNGYNITSVINGKGKMNEKVKENLRKKAKEPHRLKQAIIQGEKRRGTSIKNSSSKYCGVTFYKDKWKSGHYIDRKFKHIGTFLTEIEAAQARDIAEIKLNPNAILNFPELKNQYLKNEIIINKIKRKKSNSNILGVSFSNKTKKWHMQLKGFKNKSFKTKEDCEQYALSCITLRAGELISC